MKNFSFFIPNKCGKYSTSTPKTTPSAQSATTIMYGRNTWCFPICTCTATIMGN
ncbi:hypothetical protein MHYP_G00004070 [Metynnis hypsauchen]